jgi:predicted 3-demethylubiquinone-9 3-methyltransferase (glyoxalase superfamily)
MPKIQRITPHLWFDKQAKEAAGFYTSTFNNSVIQNTTTLHNTPSGTVDVVTIELLEQDFTLISAGPLFKFNPSVSFLVACKAKDEVDGFWEALSEGGTALTPKAEQCGWLKDKYGLSWQIVPAVMEVMLKDKDEEKIARVTEAFLKMKKFDVEELKRAYEGK